MSYEAQSRRSLDWSPTVNQTSSRSRALSIIVPAFNEAQRLQATVDGVIAAASMALDHYEVIIVNDGSADETAAIADKLAASRPFVSAIHHPVNRGVGAAYRSGLRAARYA